MKNKSDLMLVTLAMVCILTASSPVRAEGEKEKGRAYYDFGVFAYEEENYEEAEKKLKTALELNPENPFYNYQMGKIYQKMADKMEKGSEAYKTLLKDALQYVVRAWEISPDIPGLKYDMGFLKYKIEDYTGAARIFKQLSEDAPEILLAHYYAGMSLYKLNRYEEAPDYFTLAAEKNTSIQGECYYMIGICHQKSGKLEQALKMFETIRDDPAFSHLREDALTRIALVKKQQQLAKPYSLYAKLSYQYDDNVLLEPADEDYHTDEDDFVTVAYFSGKYNFLNQKTKMGIGYSHHQTWHNELEAYDLTGSTFELYLKYPLYPFSFRLAYLPSYYWVDADSYLRRHQIASEVSWRIHENFMTTFTYHYNNDDYFQYDTKDSDTHEIFLNFYYRVMNKKGYLFGGIGYETNAAAASYEDYTRVKAKLGLFLTLPYELSLGLMAKYEDKKYDAPDPNYPVERDDDKFTGSVRLSRNLFYDWLNLSAEYRYTHNDSNLKIREYDRSVTSLSLTLLY